MVLMMSSNSSNATADLLHVVANIEGSRGDW